MQIYTERVSLVVLSNLVNSTLFTVFSRTILILGTLFTPKQSGATRSKNFTLIVKPSSKTFSYIQYVYMNYFRQ